MSQKHKILIVDDHPMMRKGMAMTLDEEMDLEVTGQADSAEEAIEWLSSNEVDLAVIDISLPGMNGIELVKHIRHMYPHIKMLVISRHEEDLYAERAIKAGARGYIMKVDAGEKVVQALRNIIKGGLYVSEKVSQRILMQMAGGADVDEDPIHQLSDRELEVFELIGKGYNNKSIADHLHVSVKTVETYRSRIKDKLDIEHSGQLVQQAVQWLNSKG